MQPIPTAIEADLRRAVRLEWWTLFWQASVVAVMFFALGSSQAMKSAWVEDMLGLVPAIVFLTAVHLERKPPSRRFPFGFTRANSIAFLISATALALMGTYLVVDSAMKLVTQEHPTIGPATIAGETIWSGWPMIAALAYSVVPPVILGRLKHPLARRLSDKVLHTDALMQKADWMTGAAGVFGVAGVGYGLWWADAAAAVLIAADIVRDGFRALRVAVAELSDGAPRALDSSAISEDAEELERHLAGRFPGARVRLRETGRYISAEVSGVSTLPDTEDPQAYWPGDPGCAWRLAHITFAR